MNLKTTIALIFLIVFVSAITSYFVVKSQTNIRFVSQPREENTDYGYLEVNEERYRQIYTTTQVDLGNGLHYHKIDIKPVNKPIE